MGWLGRLFEMMPVRGRLDLRCSYGAPWRIDQGRGQANEIPYHAVLSGSATLVYPAGGRPPAAQLSAVAPRRACRHSRRTEGHGAQLNGLVSLMRWGARRRSSRRPCDAECAIDSDVRAGAAACQRDRRRAPRGLLALAGHPRLAPAVAALFNEPAHAWSLPELACLCNMSRATLARQFQEKLGRSASDLLTDIPE
jgi:AraC family transcriptional activator of mtrCDE